MGTEEDSGITESLLLEKEIYNPSDDVLKKATVKDWNAVLKRGKDDPEGFWEEAAGELDWFKKWDKVLDASNKPFYKWFVGGKCNIVHNALDRHIKTERKNKTAIIFEDESGAVEKYTYYELYKAVNKFANALKELGIGKGDRVAIYLPNIPEIAIAMLGVAKIGAIHTVVYAGFSYGALAQRVNDGEAKILITANGFNRNGKEVDLISVVNKAVETCPTLEHVIVVKRGKDNLNLPGAAKPRYKWWGDLIAGKSDECTTEVMDSEDILYILYTSGTTGKPKGVVQVHGGYMVALNRTLKWVFDIKEEDIFWCAADPGWVTGHSYIVYGPLIAGTTSVMYNGHPIYPTQDRVWDIIERHKVNIFYTAPTLIRMLMRYGSEWVEKHDLSTIRLLGSVGEPINPEAWRWYHKYAGRGRCPVMDTWWQTETGMFMISPLPVSPLKPGSATKPFPGIQADVVDKDGKSVPTGKGGYLVITTPWPSMLRTVYKDPERFKRSYWNEIPGGNYITGDLARKDEDGYFWIQGRSDDVMKIAGHRIGTADVESALVKHPKVAEAAAIGVPDALKGEVCKVFVILKEGIKGTEELAEDMKKQVRKEIGPIAVIKEVAFVDNLPKTRSGKIMRRVLKARELGLPEGDLSTLAD